MPGSSGRATEAARPATSAAFEVDAFSFTAIPFGPTWIGGSSSNWSDPGNWQGGVVAGTTGTTTNTDQAVFLQSATTSPLNIDAGRNLQSLAFATGNVNSLIIGTTTGNALVLTAGGSVQSYAGVVNPETINAPLVLEGDYAFTNNATPTTATLTFGGSISSGAASGDNDPRAQRHQHLRSANTISGAIFRDGGSRDRNWPCRAQCFRQLDSLRRK